MAKVRGGRWSWAIVAVVAAMMSWTLEPAVAQEGQALSLLTIEKKGGLTWDGVGLGTSLVAAERRTGVTLALDRNPENGANPCAPYVAVVDHNGLTLTLGFGSPRPGAKIEWLRVRFEGQQIAASASDLAAELRARIPSAEWIRPAGATDLTEGDDLSPTYRVPAGKSVQAVRFAPREWMELAEVSCFE